MLNLSAILLETHAQAAIASELACILGIPIQNDTFMLENTCLKLTPIDEQGVKLSGFQFTHNDLPSLYKHIHKTHNHADMHDGEIHINARNIPIRIGTHNITDTNTHTLPPDCVSAIDHVVVNTASSQAAKAFYGEALGIRLALEQSRPQWGGDMLFFRLNHMSIEVIATEKNPQDRDSLWGIALRTQDIHSCAARIATHGIEVSPIRDGRKAGTQVATLKSKVFSVPTLLIQHN